MKLHGVKNHDKARQYADKVRSDDAYDEQPKYEPNEASIDTVPIEIAELRSNTLLHEEENFYSDEELDRKVKNKVNTPAFFFTLIIYFTLVLGMWTLTNFNWVVLIALPGFICVIFVFSFFKEFLHRKDQQTPTLRQAMIQPSVLIREPQFSINRFLYRFKKIPGTNVSIRDFRRFLHKMGTVEHNGRLYHESRIDYISHEHRFYMYRWTWPLSFASFTCWVYMLRSAYYPTHLTANELEWWWTPPNVIYWWWVWLALCVVFVFWAWFKWTIWRSQFTVMTNLNMVVTVVPPPYFGYLIDNPDDPLPLANIIDTEKIKVPFFQRLIKCGTVTAKIQDNAVKSFTRQPHPFILAEKLRAVSQVNPLSRRDGSSFFPS